MDVDSDSGDFDADYDADDDSDDDSDYASDDESGDLNMEFEADCDESDIDINAEPDDTDIEYELSDREMQGTWELTHADKNDTEIGYPYDADDDQASNPDIYHDPDEAEPNYMTHEEMEAIAILEAQSISAATQGFHNNNEPNNDEVDFERKERKKYQWLGWIKDEDEDEEDDNE